MADRHTDDDDSGTNRRTFLKTVGATVALTATTSQAIGSSVAQSASEYETITVSGLERFDVHDDFGGTLENVLFDQREDGAMAEILAMGGDFTIRNVGFLGRAGGSGSRKQIKPGVSDPDGTGLIENVYMPGSEFDNNDCMGIYAPVDHAGTITIRNVYITGYADNGMYVSVPGSIDSAHSNPGQGVFHIENCYSVNNNIAQFRIGSDGSTVENSVACVDDASQFPPNASGHKNGRGIWFRNRANVSAQNCDVWQSTGSWGVAAADGGGGPTSLVDSRVRGDVQSGIDQTNVQSLASLPSPLDGVPTSAEAAASGQADSGSGGQNPDSGGQDGDSGGQDTDSGEEEEDPLATRFVVMSTTSLEELTYRFWVDGDASLVTDGDAQTLSEVGDEEVTTDGEYTLVTGSTGNQYGDAFDVNSSVVAFEQTGGTSDYQLLQDGTDVTDSIPQQPPGQDDGNDSETNEFTVVASSANEELSYRFVVDGPVTPVADTDDATMAAEPSGNDSVSQRDDGHYEVTGHTGNGYGDTYAVEGDVLMFARTSGSSDWTLLRDGTDVTSDVPEQLPGNDDGGSSEPRSGTLLIDGTVNPDDTSRYTFTVTESVSYDQDQSTTVDDGLAWDRMQDVVSGTTATGIVGNGVDAYQITGELENIDVRGDAEYTIEWE